MVNSYQDNTPKKRVKREEERKSEKSGLTILEKLDEYQVTNYNIQPLVSVEVSEKFGGGLSMVRLLHH